MGLEVGIHPNYYNIISTRKDGDNIMPDQEFRELYEKFAKKLVQYGLYAGVELETSKDLTHHAYLLLLCNYEKIRKRHSNFAGWLIKTNHTLVYRELVSNRRKYEVPMPEGFDPPSLIEYRMPLRDILPAGMPEKYKTIIALRYEEQLPYKEIAPRMNISEGYACVMLRRALKDLRKRLRSEEKRLKRGICFAT